MILDCPSCGAKFKVDAALLGETGRSVRCGSCAHSWHQAPRVPEAVAERPPAPEPVQESPPHGTAAADNGTWPKRIDSLDKLDEQRRRGRRGSAASPETKAPSRILGWMVLTLFLLALAGGLVVAREKIIALAPGTAAYYERLGLQAMIGDGLDLRDVTSVRRTVDGQKTLIVRGAVVNVSDRVQSVPRLRASLIDAGGTELKNWTFRVDSAELPPGSTTTFETATEDPPSDGDLKLVFVE
jgi:predicted Zn finger-like uncharacterized protein